MSEEIKPKRARPGDVPRGVMPDRSADDRIGDFKEVALGFSADAALLEATRCLQCKKPLCVEGCPVGIDIPGFIGRIAKGDATAASKVLRLTTDLPAICGRVCPQESQCEQLCIMGRKFEPVAIGALERFAADEESRSGGWAASDRAASTGKRVAVIGSGPSGLTAAGQLAKLGHGVTVLEALHEPGGVLVYGIPEFRLPKAIVAEEVATLESLGVEISLNQIVGQSVTVDELLDVEGYDAVFIGTGAGLPYFTRTPGENLNGVYTANEFLTRVNLMRAYQFPEYHTPVHVGQNVAVFGGGNTAMDAARTARRLTDGNVWLIYRRSEAEMPARDEEIEHGKDEGIKFLMLTSPLEFMDEGSGSVGGVKCIEMGLGEPDTSGRRRPVPKKGSEFTLEIDQAIVAIGNGPNRLIPQTTPGLEISNHGTIVADEHTGGTARPGVFAGGDVVTGAATVILAMGAGKVAAAAIDAYLKDYTEEEITKRYTEAVHGYFSVGPTTRNDGERRELLTAMGVPDVDSFLSAPLPHWQARVDELLDPLNPSLLPIHVSHAYHDWVWGAIAQLPKEVRVRLLQSKWGSTGLNEAAKKLWSLARGTPAGELTIIDAQLAQNPTRETTVTVREEERRSVQFWITTLASEAEMLFAAVAHLCLVPIPPVVHHQTPSGHSLALVADPGGTPLTDLTAPGFFREQWRWLVDGCARSNALGDAMGWLVREGHYMVSLKRRFVYTTDHTELFHYLPPGQLPDEAPVVKLLAGIAEQVREGGDDAVLQVYETAYLSQWEIIEERWPRIRELLVERGDLLAAYGFDDPQQAIDLVAEAIKIDRTTYLTEVYTHFLGEWWQRMEMSMQSWRQDMVLPTHS